MKTGLFFGSFNPVHTGHLLISEYILEFYDLEEVWFVISPQNPLKNGAGLVAEVHRLEMLQRAVAECDGRVKLCDVELSMPKPSYTIDTLELLESKHPSHQFVVIMGSDGVESLPKWKSYDRLISGWDFYVYPRSSNAHLMTFPSPRFTLIDAPVIDISSTQIRGILERGSDVIGFVPNDVWEYISNTHLYNSTTQ